MAPRTCRIFRFGSRTNEGKVLYLATLKVGNLKLLCKVRCGDCAPTATNEVGLDIDQVRDSVSLCPEVQGLTTCTGTDLS